MPLDRESLYEASKEETTNLNNLYPRGTVFRISANTFNIPIDYRMHTVGKTELLPSLQQKNITQLPEIGHNMFLCIDFGTKQPIVTGSVKKILVNPECPLRSAIVYVDILTEEEAVKLECIPFRAEQFMISMVSPSEATQP